MPYFDGKTRFAVVVEYKDSLFGNNITTLEYNLLEMSPTLSNLLELFEEDDGTYLMMDNNPFYLNFDVSIKSSGLEIKNIEISKAI